jgi:6-phosphogluconate dehydrogenase
MRMAMIGLGRMGGNMVRRLRRAGIDVVGYARHPEAVTGLAREAGMMPAESLAQAVAQLSAPRIVWLMLPAGEATEQTVLALGELLEDGDVVVDGGNTHYRDTQRRHAWLAGRGIGLLDVGTSGGVWGLEEGYCLMVGGAPAGVSLLEPALAALAPAPDRGWAHVGSSGAGHYVKMIHNGIEYGLMQAYAEGFALLHGKAELDLDVAQIAELWRHGSVVRSWLLDLIARGLEADPSLADIAPHVEDSGEGRWTVSDAVEQGIPAPVITLALQMRFASRDAEGYPHRLLAMLRHAFGGHDLRQGGD